MKILSILLVLMFLTGASMAQWYPGGNSVRMSTIASAESSDDDQLATATPANNTTHILMTSGFLAQPDVPRNLIVTPSGSATGSLKFTGTDIGDDAITENLTFTTTGVVAGAKAFKTVTRIDGTFSQGTARTLKIGTGNLLGMNIRLATNTVFIAALNSVREATAPAVTVSSTVLSLNTIDTDSAPGGYVTKYWYVI